MARLSPRCQRHVDESADATRRGDIDAATAHLRAAYSLGTDRDRKILVAAAAETLRIRT